MTSERAKQGTSEGLSFGRRVVRRVQLMVNAPGEVRSRNEKIAELRAQVRELRAEADRANRRIEAQSRRVVELESTVKARDEDVAAARAGLRAAERENGAAQVELASRRSEIRRIVKQVGAEQAATALAALPSEVRDVVERVLGEHLTMIGDNVALLARAVLDTQAQAVPGLLVECGTARGGSAIVMAAAKAAERALFVYDVFGTIPAPSEHDGADVHKRYATIAAGRATGLDGETYYGYRDNLYAEVSESFARFGHPVDESRVTLVRGLFEDTIDLHEPVALAHLDGDWYESTRVCLERIYPLLSVGGRLVVDDYFQWSGCRRAVDEYFAGRSGFRFEVHGRLHVIREEEGW